MMQYSLELPYMALETSVITFTSTYMGLEVTTLDCEWTSIVKSFEVALTYNTVIILSIGLDLNLPYNYVKS